MTRKEEIEKASIKYQMSISPVAVGGAAFADDVEQMNINPSFVAGAEWADKTMIEKSCEWLKNNMHNYLVAKADGADYRITIFNDFKQAMIEE